MDMEGGVPAVKKVRRDVQSIPFLKKPMPPQQQQIQHQSQFHFVPQSQQQPKRSLIAPQSSPQIHHFYQQQQRIHNMQNSPQGPMRSLPKIGTLNLISPERDLPSSTGTPPWLPASLTMPLHAVSSGYAGASPSPSNSGRRMVLKRAPDDWRLTSSPNTSMSFATSSGNSINYISPPPQSSPPAYMISPASFAGPVSVSVTGAYNFPPRMSSPTPTPPPPTSSAPTPPVNVDPVRATAIEKRRMKLRQVAASHQEEFEVHCQALLALQQEWREETHNGLIKV